MIEPLNDQSSEKDSTVFPQGLPLDRMYRVMDVGKALGNRSQADINKALEAIRKRLATLQEEQFEALDKAIKARDLSSLWSFASQICSFAYTGASIGGGALLLSQGNPLGWQFVASGVMLLANEVFSYKDRWESIAKTLSFGNQTVEYALHTALPKIAMVASFFLNTRAMIKLPIDLKEKIEWAQWIYAGVGGAIHIGSVYTKIRQIFAEGKVKALDIEINATNLKVSQLLLIQGRSSEASKRVQAGWRRIIKSQINQTADFAKP